MKTFAFNVSRRPPSDTFTCFTSTTPHATTFTYQPSHPAAGRSRAPAPPPSSQTPSPRQPPSSPSPQPNSAPPNETPLEKVARLRAAHRATISSQAASPFDRLIESGRGIADRAHRITAYGLILFSGLAVCVTAYGTISLITHSRRQKRAWVERELDRLDNARSAFLRGEASAEQLHLLEQERAGLEMESARLRDAQRKKEQGVWGRVKGMIGQGVASGEMGLESERERERRLMKARGRAGEEGWIEGEVPAVPAPAPGSVVRERVQVAPSHIPGVGVDSKGRPVPANRTEYVTRNIDDEPNMVAKDFTAPTPRVGGPLDAMANNFAGAVAGSSNEGKGWFKWVGRSGSKSSD